MTADMPPLPPVNGWVGNRQIGCMVAPAMKRTDDDNRCKQIGVGASILGLLTLVVCGALIGWGYLPGLLGEWVGLMVGVATTPFILEATFVVIGLILVLIINHWRRQRAGDELVYLEQADEAEAGPGRLPDHAGWAIYSHEPLAGEVPPLQAQAEGALVIGDYEGAAECLAGMSEAELKRPETLEVRLALAKATGRGELVEPLENELRAARAAAAVEGTEVP